MIFQLRLFIIVRALGCDSRSVLALSRTTSLLGSLTMHTTWKKDLLVSLDTTQDLKTPKSRPYPDFTLCLHAPLSSTSTLVEQPKHTFLHLIVRILADIFPRFRVLRPIATMSVRRNLTRFGPRATCGDCGEDFLDVLALEGVGEESGPDRLDFLDAGGREESLELLRRNGEVIVSEN